MIDDCTFSYSYSHRFLSYPIVCLITKSFSTLTPRLPSYFAYDLICNTEIPVNCSLLPIVVFSILWRHRWRKVSISCAAILGCSFNTLSHFFTIHFSVSNDGGCQSCIIFRQRLSPPSFTQSLLPSNFPFSLEWSLCVQRSRATLSPLWLPYWICAGMSAGYITPLKPNHSLETVFGGEPSSWQLLTSANKMSTIGTRIPCKARRTKESYAIVTQPYVGIGTT